MYELSVERSFCAAHALLIGGEREPLHGHTWHVTLTVRGVGLDPDGLLLDFHDLEARLEEVIGRWHNANLNESEAFVSTNPTAENVARRIADSMEAGLPRGVRVGSVHVTEAPGCRAAYFPDAP
jgi:6-pyruvoyltetrahydropterin/6-carboxytetrahydropterin synthase